MARRVEILELDERRIVLLTEGFGPRFVNAIRRLAMSDVPTMAVDFVYFYENNTGIHDEIIAHRLGLTVLDSNVAIGKYRSPEECAGAPEHDETCYAKIEIDVSQDVEEDTGRYVAAEEMEISDPDVKPVYPRTMLFYIAPGQRVQLVAFARLGRGREHAKWSPVTVAASRYTPIIYYDSGRITEECRRCLEPYYRELLEKIEESGGSGRLVLPTLSRTSGLRYCAETACNGAIKVVYDDTMIVLEVESTGALRPERIVYEAARLLKARARRVAELLREGASG